MLQLDTPRLCLRRWRDDDRAPFAALNADAEVTRYLLGPLPRMVSDAMVDRMEQHFDAHGYGLWAIQRSDDRALLGFAGLQHVTFDAAFTPAVEIGWRMRRDAWGHGYATEAAAAALSDAFERVGLDAVVAFTVPPNVRSQQVMMRLGMQRDAAGDFDHPRLPLTHPLRPHLLYRLTRDAWRERALH
jgi:RimJ/RimL family protein N-acetyltransferase